MYKLYLNKNRGWRGLAEARLLDEDYNVIKSMIFSFSQKVWNDMLCGIMVMQDHYNYMIIRFLDQDCKLPKPTQQRSVLIKDVVLPVVDIIQYPKETWRIDHKTLAEFIAIDNFIKNRNNHTTSDFNCIGIRVVPLI